MGVRRKCRGGSSFGSGITWRLAASILFPAMLSVGLAAPCAGAAGRGQSGAHLVRSWKVVRSPEPHAEVGGLSDVSCPTVTFCAAVGPNLSTALLLKVTGSDAIAEVQEHGRWSKPSLFKPTTAGFSSLNGVDCTSPSFCLAVGATLSHGAYVPFAVGYDGKTWHVVSTSGLLHTAAYNGGYGLAAFELDAVTCTKPTFCLAVGGATLGSGLGVMFTAQYSRTSWSLVPAGAGLLTGTLLSVGCASEHACVAVGHAPTGVVGATGSGANLPLRALEIYFDGHSWSAVQEDPIPAGSGTMSSYSTAVVCSRHGPCYGAGGIANGSSSTPALFVSSTQQAPVKRLYEDQHGSGIVNGLSCAGKVCTVVGAGAHGLLADVVTGAHWAAGRLPKFPAGALAGISCPSPSTCLAVGNTGTSRAKPLVVQESKGKK